MLALCLLMFIFGSTGQSLDMDEPKDSQVQSVVRQDFQDFISKHSLVLMEFYAPWSGQSRLFAPKYRQTAATLASSSLPRPVVLAKYDDSTEEQRKLRAGAVYNFHSYPALFVFDQGKHHRYTGSLEPDAIVTYMTALSKGQSVTIEQKAAGLFESLPNYNEDVLTELSENMIETSVLTEQHVFRTIAHVPYCPTRLTLCSRARTNAAHLGCRRIPRSYPIPPQPCNTPTTAHAATLSRT